MSVTGGSVSVRHPAQHRSRSRLSPQAYLATTTRILRQLAADHRSVAMILVVPSLIITLMYFMFQNAPHRPGAPTPFNNACLIMLGVFPLIVMFLITSITMQRERVSGTLERILTTPLRRLDLLAAYGTAFSIAAAAQATLACIVSFWLLGLDTAGSPIMVFVIAIINAVLGVGLGGGCHGHWIEPCDRLKRLPHSKSDSSTAGAVKSATLSPVMRNCSANQARSSSAMSSTESSPVATQ